LTRTFRIYNKRPIIHGPGFRGWISSQKLKAEDLIDPLANDLLWPTWIGYHPYAAWGRMRGWRDWRLDSRRRQENKRDLRELSWEYAPFGISDVYDFSYSCEYEYYTNDRNLFIPLEQ
jgi:hypothetical protein